MTPLGLGSGSSANLAWILLQDVESPKEVEKVVRWELS